MLALLDDRLQLRKALTLRAILDGLATLREDPAVPALVQRLQTIAPLGLPELLHREGWESRLPAAVADTLAHPGGEATSCSLEVPLEDTLAFLATLAADPSPTLASAGLFLTACLDGGRARSMAAELGLPGAPLLLRQTARAVEALDGPPALRDFPELEKRVFLATSDVFRRSDADTLDALAARADVRAFAKGELITEAGDTCRELLLLLLLLIEGIARVHHRDGERTWVKDLQPGRVLDELQVLTHSSSENTIVAEADGTRLLAVPVDSFAAVLERDPDFARRVLELESGQLQRLMDAPLGGPPGALRGHGDRGRRYHDAGTGGQCLRPLALGRNNCGSLRLPAVCRRNGPGRRPPPDGLRSAGSPRPPSPAW
ncbi:MAG: cyclic nucleotide-binding domain-containing protein [Cyanobacteriota bacterium]|nr:cyclic nucleotide-binding domain-containing protein [Cyanobacteriota bacterium]